MLNIAEAAEEVNINFYEIVQADLAAERASHAYLFVGRERPDRQTLPAQLEVPATEVLWLEDDTIAAVRHFLRAAHLKPRLGQRRFAVIVNLAALSRPAEQALLKTIEEPPAHLIWLLFADQLSMLATTISRVRVVDLDSPQIVSERAAALWSGLNQPSLSQAFMAAAELANEPTMTALLVEMITAVRQSAPAANRETALRALRQAWLASRTTAAKRLIAEQLVLAVRR